jgi:hypothetical protein
MNPLRLRPGSLLLLVFAAPMLARADTDACTLVSAEQVSAAVHVPVGAGTHVMASFVKTCTWTPTASSNVRAVTVNVQTASFYDGAKNVGLKTAAALPGAQLKATSVGDEGFYDIKGEMAQLFFKKGGSSVKVAVYAKTGAEQIEAMELEIAKLVAAKL